MSTHYVNNTTVFKYLSDEDLAESLITRMNFFWTFDFEAVFL